MAYTVASTFTHGDFVRAADLNTISAGQIDINNRLADHQPNPCTKELGTDGLARFVHRQRWLHYKSTGQIVDPAGSEDDVSLPNPSDNWVNVYDLDSVSWLSYGAIYYVTGVDFACEDKEG